MCGETFAILMILVAKMLEMQLVLMDYAHVIARMGLMVLFVKLISMKQMEPVIDFFVFVDPWSLRDF